MPKTWACPFFSWEERLCVHCEGARVKFRDREARKEYIDRYCASVPGWINCSFADHLNNQYERSIHNAGKEYRQAAAAAGRK